MFTKNSITKFKYLCLINLFLISAAFSAPVVLTVGSATDSDCDYSTVFDAVNSGLNNMKIRISNELIITTGITIFDQSILSIEGGYANCADAANDIVDFINPYSDVSNLNAGVAISITYFTTVNQNMTLTGLKVYDSNGGIRITSGVDNTHLRVDMSAVDIYDNNFYGIKTTGSAVVVFYDHGRIEHNINADKGGGIECYDSQVDFGPDVTIAANEAFVGGGIYANNCTINLLAGDNSAILDKGIINNKATNAGGGVYLKNALMLGSGMNTHPISISGNIVTSDAVDGRGGAVYLTSGSGLQLTNARIDNNKAKVSGAAIYTIHDDNSLSTGGYILARDAGGCTYAETCVSVSGNSVSNNATNGAVIMQDGGSLGYINNAVIENNVSLGASSLFLAKSGSTLNFNSTLVTNNESSSHLFEQIDQSVIIVRYSTLADNTVLNYFNVQYDNNNAQTLEVDASVIKNGQATVAYLNNDNGNHDAQVKCSLVETDDSTGVVQNQSVIGLPHFVGNGNYKLLPDSQAIDSTCAVLLVNDIAKKDVRGQLRAEDGTADLGAYEYISNDDVIFKNSFEGGL